MTSLKLCLFSPRLTKCLCWVCSGCPGRRKQTHGAEEPEASDFLGDDNQEACLQKQPSSVFATEPVGRRRRSGAGQAQPSLGTPSTPSTPSAAAPQHPRLLPVARRVGAWAGSPTLLTEPQAKEARESREILVLKKSVMGGKGEDQASEERSTFHLLSWCQSLQDPHRLRLPTIRRFQSQPRRLCRHRV